MPHAAQMALDSTTKQTDSECENMLWGGGYGFRARQALPVAVKYRLAIQLLLKLKEGILYPYYERNTDILPDQISFGSSRRVW